MYNRCINISQKNVPKHDSDDFTNWEQYQQNGAKQVLHDSF